MPGPPLNSVKAAQSMTPPSVRPFRFQKSYNGTQPGDPTKAAAALLRVALLSEPPLRLLLGSDSYAAAEKSAVDKIESDRNWKDLSLSTDYSPDETPV